MSLSDELIPEPVLGDPIHVDGDFSIHVGPWPNPLWVGQQGYYMVNGRTNIIEGVFGTEAMGRGECRRANEELQQVLTGGGPLTTSDDAAFQAMMHRLNQNQPN
jgi:hypothetical protein